MIARRFLGVLIGAAGLVLLSGCSMFGSSGPSANRVGSGETAVAASGMKIVDVTDSVARRILAGQKRELFSEAFGASPPMGGILGSGDVLVVSIWEAPPASLFGSAALDVRGVGGGALAITFPEQMISIDGTINIPFAGLVPAAGKSPQELERLVAQRLTGKANQPQVMVRVIKNATSRVTVVGEVTASTQMPLTPKGERLLDALASAGGVRQPVGKTTVQITRGKQVQSLALDTVIQDPRQNIALQPGDVVTALFQPLSFTSLGATGTNQEIQFEAQGITLAQALARAGGLNDARANAQGVFIFRFENAALVDGEIGANQTTPDGRVPVVYRVRLEGSGFLLRGPRVSDPRQGRDVRCERTGGRVAEVPQHTHRSGFLGTGPDGYREVRVSDLVELGYWLEPNMILVTGGAGYIGSHTVTELLSRGDEVVVLDNLHNSSLKMLDRIEAICGQRSEFVEADVRDKAGLRNAFDSYPIDAVVHFAGLKAVRDPAPQLVVIGQRGWECEQVVDLLDRCTALQGHVTELPRCGDQELATWLAHAQALLFPSFTEGFGMPLVEALTLGVPVIASDLPVFREVAGGIPDYLDPIDGLGWYQRVLGYLAVGGPMRCAQRVRMEGFRAPTWGEHFTVVESLLDRVGRGHT